MKPVSITVAFFALALTTSAQFCYVPDNLESAPCCTPVDLNVPAFPGFGLQSQGICWDSCSVTAQVCLRVDAAPPVQTGCGEYLMPMEVSDCAGVTLLTGDAQLNYTRTWIEQPIPGGPDLQVYRFVFKADLFGDYLTTPVCPVPPSLGPYPTAFWYGYVDWAFDCLTGAWQNAIVIYHGADAFTHHPLISSQPGVFNPTETYAIVGPDTGANPFVPVTVPAPAGPVFAEAMRNTMSPIPGACLAEEPVLQGGLSHIITLCMNPLSFIPGLQHLSRLAGSGVCGGAFTTLNVFPTVPWYEMVTSSIGTWTTSATYPGEEQAAVSEGLFFYTDVCGGAGTVQNSLDVFYGSITQDGYFMLPLTPVGGGQTQVDLASNYSNPFPGPISLPIIGNVMPTDHLIYLTVF